MPSLPWLLSPPSPPLTSSALAFTLSPHPLTSVLPRSRLPPYPHLPTGHSPGPSPFPPLPSPQCPPVTPPCPRSFPHHRHPPCPPPQVPSRPVTPLRSFPRPPTHLPTHPPPPALPPRFPPLAPSLAPAPPAHSPDNLQPWTGTGERIFINAPEWPERDRQ